jgi:lipoate-protein ligase A
VRWRLIEDPPQDGYRNMALDEALLESCASGAEGFPCLRLYAFAPPCLSLGASQDHAAACDLAECRARGIDVVRRPSGGRAVLHADEVTYAVVARCGAAPFAGGVLETYGTITSALAAAFARLGIRAEPARGEPGGAAPGGAEPCFAAPAPHELAAGAHKVAGSAQARRRGAFLQHGSIPISLDARTLARVCGAPPGAPLPEVAGIARLLGRAVDRAEVAAALRAGFEESLGAGLVPGAYAAAERERAELLRARRYLATAWTFRR